MLADGDFDRAVAGLLQVLHGAGELGVFAILVALVVGVFRIARGVEATKRTADLLLKEAQATTNHLAHLAKSGREEAGKGLAAAPRQPPAGGPYWVTGAMRQTGEDVRIVVATKTPEEARAAAEKRGILVSSVDTA